MTASHNAAPANAAGNTPSASTAPPITLRLLAGVVGGLSGGMVFGALMAMMGMLPMIASLIGSTSAAVGFIVHLVISILIGLVLTIPGAGLLTGSLVKSAFIGLVYGALWWVLGPLVIMPAMMGMPVLTLGGSSLMSLVGHLMYGLILGLVAAVIIRRRR
ncbi:DUF6789 family protein [Arthrobacter sp. Br18]|uniref:DUF6789 family protein n=1 Tax=Arthrobacter sp. Br18 TaxID=1312954 RepID=UPI0004B262F9|nr:DUF6789 family protein [Arthrobacter sp. Br18]